MNLIHIKCVIEVAETGSVTKASEALLMAPPNLSREIKELETELGIDIFARTSRGMILTPDGEKFIGYAKKIMAQVSEIKSAFGDSEKHKQRFSVSVPWATYISQAFADFSNSIKAEKAEIFYNETNSSGVIKNILEADYRLGIVRYEERYDKYFKNMFEEKGLVYELISQFRHVLVMNRNSPLAELSEIHLSDLSPMIEIVHADPYASVTPLSPDGKDASHDKAGKRIFIFERGSQFDLLCKNPNTFMWVSPLPQETLDRYNLIEAECSDNKKIYKDVFIYRRNYSLSDLDRQFITEVCISRRKYLKKTEM